MTLLEAEPTLGGHTLTDDSAGFPVDLGFQVTNLAARPPRLDEPFRLTPSTPAPR